MFSYIGCLMKSGSRQWVINGCVHFTYKLARWPTMYIRSSATGITLTDLCPTCVQQCRKYLVSISEYNIWSLHWICWRNCVWRKAYCIYFCSTVRVDFSNLAVKAVVFKIYNTLLASETVCVLQQRHMSIFLM